MAVKRRKSYCAQFKFQVALGRAEGIKTISELAAEHSVHPNQISQWKRQLLEDVPSVPRTTVPEKEHKIYPYLLRDLEIRHPNHVWAADISYIRMHQGFMYLVAIMDWFSRYVIAWKLSNTLDASRP
jgi:putative transposase